MEEKFGEMYRGGGLRQFWDCLDRPQREALLAISSGTVLNIISCEGCKDLVGTSLRNLEDQAWGTMCQLPESFTRGYVNHTGKVTRAASVPKSSFVILIKLLNDGSYVTEPVISPKSTIITAQALDFVQYIASPHMTAFGPGDGHFHVVQDAYLRRVIDHIDTTLCSTYSKGVPADESFTAPWLSQQHCPYCEGKFNLRFVDTLTYPRPVTKFRLVFHRNMMLGALREILAAEAGLDSSKLILIYKGRPIPHDKDKIMLENIPLENNGMIAISRVLGEESTESGSVQRNKFFVGDLLFGPGTIGSGDRNARGLDSDSLDLGSSAIGQLKLSHAFQVLGEALHDLFMARLSRVWLADMKARNSAEELLASLVEEEAEEANREQGRRLKNKKRKEKGKRRKEEKEKLLFQRKEIEEKSKSERSINEKEKQKQLIESKQLARKKDGNAEIGPKIISQPWNGVKKAHRIIMRQTSREIKNTNIITVPKSCEEEESGIISPELSEEVNIIIKSSSSNEKNLNETAPTRPMMEKLNIIIPHHEKPGILDCTKSLLKTPVYFGWCSSCGTMLSTLGTVQCISCKRPPLLSLPFFEKLHGSNHISEKDEIPSNFLYRNGTDDHFLSFLDVCGIKLNGGWLD